ncbi:MAG: enterochelin esterase [Acidobacteria bacterium]|nr:enterochelin esterase [Acidobacteriota bacterium]NIM62183.1 enterochelin esterase [Acidobacteriota bacterium]NIO58977.1 enterochelin esterase [Acidobacteriota bacterium]NIQ30023.1 enterochelin esterase [Acidobacteriota bacterium]NIQ84789.1 enterochelin esterase [Acidobacteriota bacterium]
MSSVLDRFLDQTPGGETIDAFLSGRTFPILEGDRVTFVFRGRADAVNLRHWIFGLPSSQPFERVDGTDLWRLTLDLPECSRVEYKIEHIEGENRQWLMDPLNDRVAHDPFGANSVCYGRGYKTPPWVLPDEEARPGAMEQFRVISKVYRDRREIGVYLPARYRKRRRYPLLVVHDGHDYLRFADLRRVLDNLIHRLEIPPMIVALTTSPDRLTEYGADPRQADFLADELIPAMNARYPLIDRPEARMLMGASFGAVAALSAAWLRQGVYGGLLLQSGSFAFSDIGKHGRGPALDPVARFVNAFREDPGHPCDKVFVSCGIYESLIYENRSLVPVLQGAQMELRYVEARDGHNWENWRDRLREALSWLSPGPLWMVYE